MRRKAPKKITAFFRCNDCGMPDFENKDKCGCGGDDWLRGRWVYELVRSKEEDQ